MHPVIYDEFRQIIERLGPVGRILEIGAAPNHYSLLAMDILQGQSRVGINLAPPAHYKGFDIIQGNANAMSMFRDGWFHCVLSNATLEHDPFFWKTCAEIRRVLRHGGLAIIGVPGFSPEADVDVLGLPDPWCGEVAETHRQWEECTLTFKFHGFPHDYYRFSEAAVREGIFEGYRDVTVKAVMVPPRFVAHGYKSEESSQRQPKQGRNWIRPIAILQKRLFDSGKQ